jgi:hypothetical protein
VLGQGNVHLCVIHSGDLSRSMHTRNVKVRTGRSGDGRMSCAAVVPTWPSSVVCCCGPDLAEQQQSGVQLALKEARSM